MFNVSMKNLLKFRFTIDFNDEIYEKFITMNAILVMM
jgi:hypothetical protein